MEVQLEKQVGLDQIDAYVNTIVDEIMKELFKLKKLFKYAVTVFIQQKKKISAQWPAQMPPNLVTKSKSNINLTRKNTASSNPQ